MTSSEDDTIIDFPIYQPTESVDAESFDERDLEIAAATHVGRVRTRNEDQYCIVRRTRTGEVLSSSLPEDHLPNGEEKSWLMLVADGLGGQVSGEVASATAIRTILDFANRLSSWIMRPIDGLREDLAERVDLYMQAIQKEMQAQAESNPGLAGMATTITAAYVYGTSATIVNLGDSRSYLIRDGEIHQITQDHTLAQELQDKGIPAESTRPYRNVLTRSLGTDNKPIHCDLFHLQVQPGDRLLLCSDGLSDMVKDLAMLETLKSEAGTKEACEKLVLHALSNGGRDNITVVLATVKDGLAS